MRYTTFDSPTGTLMFIGNENSVTGLHWLANYNPEDMEGNYVRDDEFFALARQQVEDYFVKGRKDFDLTFELTGSPFQKKVWQALSEIPYGKTATYGEIASRIGHPDAHRAVGTAVGSNPLVIIIPCHRVVPKSGGIGQFGGGVPAKKLLLELEHGVQ